VSERYWSVCVLALTPAHTQNTHAKVALGGGMRWDFSKDSYGGSGDSKPPLYVGSLGNRTSPAPQRAGSSTGKLRLATMATAGSTISPGPSPRSPPAVGATITPGGASRGPTFGIEAATAQPAKTQPVKTQPATQPSQKLAGGTLGLPRAGFSSSFRSPSPQPESQSSPADGGKPLLSGYYGQHKTGGMSVA
jgi:hypothetical protein